VATPVSAPRSPAPAIKKQAGWTPQPLPAATTENHAGKLFVGRYMLLRKIGSGGMSTIYEARDATLGARVVVKIMRGDLPSDPVDRFRREAHVLARLQHEHIARIIDRQDPEDGPRFLVTDYIDGLDLNLLRRRGPVPAAVVVELGLQAAGALAYVHAAGVIHRDIKPSNMMLVRHPGGDVFVRVIDFGIAKLERGSDLAAPDSAPAGARRETRGDVVVGTAPYWCGHEGPRRDVYALALTLAQLLTGDEPDPAVDLDGRAPPMLAQALMTALRGETITTMEALHAALREASAQGSSEAAEVERRRYVARAFLTPQNDEPDTAQKVEDARMFAGRFILAGDLGQGGMGRVQVAFDTVNRRRVALKTIHPRCAGMKNLEHRFRREARALAAIEHSGAPILYERGDLPEPFFTMEIVEGVTLTAVLRQERKIEPHRALNLAIDLGGILCAAHEAGVIHRDVKPDNIVIGQGDRVRLLDFGACLLLPRFHRRHLLFPATPPDQRYTTGELEAVGTPGYTAPEIMEMHGGTSPRSDVYSVCAVLYEMLTGRRFADPASGRPRPIERGEFPASLGPMADLLRRGTAREPSDRIASMADLVRCLEIVRASLLRARQRRLLVLVAVIAASTAALAALTLRPVTPPVAEAPTMAVISPPEVPNACPSPPPAPVLPDVGPRDARPSASISPPPELPAPEVAKPTRIGPRRDAAAAPVAAALTEATVARRLATRRDRLRECAAPLLVLNLTITAGRAVLSSVNGMAEGDPVYMCVRDRLRGLSFPRQREPATFALTIPLNEPEAK